MRPPGDANWKESAAEIGGRTRTTFMAILPDMAAAQAFVGHYWEAAYAERSALFIHDLPPVLGPPIYMPGVSGPCYRPTPQPLEVCFIPDVSFAEVWPYAKSMGFLLKPGLSPEVVAACDRFLGQLASRNPIGVESVGQGFAMFRRHNDGGAFDIADMRRACELNVAVLGGPQDETHTDKSMPRHFVKMGFFYFGA